MCRRSSGSTPTLPASRWGLQGARCSAAAPAVLTSGYCPAAPPWTGSPWSLRTSGPTPAWCQPLAARSEWPTLSQGIAPPGWPQVIPPKGWAPRRRTPDLSKIRINTPIKQHVFGKSGSYVCILEEQRVRAWRGGCGWGALRPSAAAAAGLLLLRGCFSCCRQAPAVAPASAWLDAACILLPCFRG